MAENGIKTYKIVINGLTESIDAVKTLNDQLHLLERSINALQGKAINVGSKETSGGGSKSSSTSSLSEEEKIQKQINQLEEKRIAHSKQIYQNYLAAKDVLKETENDQKQLAATERLTAQNYANTIAGMKQELADIKTVMQTVDLGDSDQFSQMTQRANELNESLKKIEESYGQFARNVGNYKSAADGFKGLKVEIGGVTQEFDTAKQALRTLKQEMQTLSTKQDMGLISEEEAKRLEDLIPTVKQLESSIQDAGKPMDALMDSMQSVMALAQTGKGFAAFFGIDDDEVQKSIQKLVALQSAMQGLQTIQKQMQTKEGIGQWLTKGNDAIDKLVNSIFGVEKASKAATVASKALGTALKAIGIGAIVAVVTTLISLLEQWSDKQKKAAEEAEEAAEKITKAVDDQRQAYVSASAQYMNTASRLSHLRAEYMTTNNELRKTNIIKEAAEEFKKLGIDVKSVSDAQRIFVKEGDKVIQMLKLQGDAAAISALRMEAFKKSFERALENNNDVNYAYYSASYNKDVVALDERLNQINGQLSALKDKYIKKDADKTTKANAAALAKEKKLAKEIEDNERTLQNLRLRIMDDGLNKRLMQLDEEKRQTLNKLKQNSTAYIEAEKSFNELRKKEIQKYNEERSKSIGNEQYNNQINFLNNGIDEFSSAVPRKSAILTEKEINELNSIYQNEEEIQKLYALRGEKDLKETLQKRLDIAREYSTDYLSKAEKLLNEREKIEKEHYKTIKKQAKDEENKRWGDDFKALKQRVEETEKAYGKIENIIEEKQAKEEELTEEEKKIYEEKKEALSDYKTAFLNHVQKLKNIQQEYDNNLISLSIKTNNEQSKISEAYFNEQISNLREFQSKANQEISKQPVYDTAGFGIINLSQTKKNFKEIKDSVTTSLEEINKERQKLTESFNNELISAEAYNSMLTQFNDLEAGAKEELQQIENDINELGGQWWGSIHKWLQDVSQVAEEILNAIWAAEEAEFDHQQDMIDKYNELLQEKLDKQEEILDKHKDAVNQIEDELQNARGDRRQHLIDQLNAEIAAERNAVAEKKKLEKEQEALKKKEEALDLARKKAQQKKDITTAAINAAMAISYAAANNWPMPAIPLMALATAAGAAQIAAIKAQKYAKGGMLEGPSHKEGGIPVGNTGIEVEGKEYVIRKKSTKDNVPVLDFINKSERKLSLDDFIDFYSTKPKRTIQTIRSRFADGGQITSIPNVDVASTMKDIVMIQSQQPVYVTVKDIQDGINRVDRVKVLAGMKN